MFQRKKPIEKEWLNLIKRENAYLDKRKEKQDSKVNLFLEEKVPENLQNTLSIAFTKAFYLVFDKGIGIIEKTYDRKQLQEDFQIREYTDCVKQSRKSLTAFSKKAKQTKRGNVILTTFSGIGLGFLGIGLPDIVLFTSLLLKSVYEIALNYGFDYKNDTEKKFILRLMQTSLSYGDDLIRLNDEINRSMDENILDKEMEYYIENTAACLSKELLYMKFLQGIPVVGALGGAYDAIYMHRVTEYAEMKYRRRLYDQKIKEIV